MPRSSNLAPLVVVLCVFLLAAYVGAYFAMVSPGKDVWPLENYRAYQRQAEVFFWPLEQVDRRLRPDAWQRRFDELL